MDELLLAVAKIVLPHESPDEEIGKIYSSSEFPDRKTGIFRIVNGRICRWTARESGAFWEEQRLSTNEQRFD